MKTLQAEGSSIKRIAVQLAMQRETVSKYILAENPTRQSFNDVGMIENCFNSIKKRIKEHSNIMALMTNSDMIQMRNMIWKNSQSSTTTKLTKVYTIS